MKKRPRPQKLSFSKRLKKIAAQKTLMEDAQYSYQYYTIPFNYFHTLIVSELSNLPDYRKEFWRTIPNGVYDYEKAKSSLEKYQLFIETRIHSIIEKHSIAYWMHVSRRIAPGTLGRDERVETVMITRSVIIAGIQKYGHSNSQNDIQISTNASLERVLNGFFLKPQFEKLKNIFLTIPAQLVILDFDEKNLLDYYKLEKLAYEIWAIGAKSRVISKGANLIVNNNSRDILSDDRSDELEDLLSIFDERQAVTSSSATGTVFKSKPDSHIGRVLLTQLLADRSRERYFSPIPGLQFVKGNLPNYDLVLFDIKQFLHAHLPLAKDFEEKNDAKLEYTIATITSICLSVLSELQKEDLDSFINLISRSYKIFELHEFKEGVSKNWLLICKWLDMEFASNEIEIQRAINFLTLTENEAGAISLLTYGPLKLIIPGVDHRSILFDYSIISDVLYNLFSGIPLAQHNFRGQLLEDSLKSKRSFLPTKECKGLDGTSKQMDYSVQKGDTLIIAECKVVARSFGSFSGQIAAVNLRANKVVEKGLTEVDDKVDWLIKHPKGKNYDISQFKKILGVVVSPFPEFIDSKQSKFWLTDRLPRVLTIEEFQNLIDSNLKGVQNIQTFG